jgi:hypothetical protein
LINVLKVLRILKRKPQRCHALARCRKHLNFCAFLELLRKFKQSLRAAEKSQEKVEANGTWFLSRVLWFSVSRNVLFCQENENSNVDNFLPELDISRALFS